MRRFANIAVTMLVAIWIMSAIPRVALSYHLPPYGMSPEERQLPAEETLGKYQSKLDRVSTYVPLNVADARRKDYKNRLSPKERRMMKGYEETRHAQRFWIYVVTLKGDMIALQGDGSSPAATIEADSMAKSRSRPPDAYMSSSTWRSSGSVRIEADCHVTPRSRDTISSQSATNLRFETARVRS